MSTDNVYHNLGRDLVEQVDGYEVLNDEDPSEEMLETIGRQFLHAGGPASGVQSYQDLDYRFASQEILPRIGDDIIEEHAEAPIGQHSDDLQRVLHYFRRAPTRGKYIIVETSREGSLAGDPRVVDQHGSIPPQYPDLDE